MATTVSEDREFFAAVMPSSIGFLESAIDWISSNLEPENVYSREALESWARDNGFVREE